MSETPYYLPSHTFMCASHCANTYEHFPIAFRPCFYCISLADANLGQLSVPKYYAGLSACLWWVRFWFGSCILALSFTLVSCRTLLVAILL